MKLALVHDHLCGVGGAERVFQYLCEEFVEADIYTLAYRPKQTLPYFATRKIHTTWLNPLIGNAELFRWSFLLATYAMQQLDLSSYDLVLSSSATTAKYVNAKKHICYCYIPTRALWHFDQYFNNSIKRYCLKPFLTALKKRDFRIAQSIHHFVAISQSSRQYIHTYYDREADIIPCPIETEKFTPKGTKKEHYLLVSRLEVWKKVDYAIEAFNQLGKPLRIVGQGAEEDRLRRMAKNNIVFLGPLDDAALAREYSACKAVIFTPFLEYGLIPLEANASGTPVICYGRGGVEETMIPGKTALFFYEQNALALAQAVQEFEQLSFDQNTLVSHAAQWNVASFKKKMRSLVDLFSQEAISETRKRPR